MESQKTKENTGFKGHGECGGYSPPKNQERHNLNL